MTKSFFFSALALGFALTASAADVPTPIATLTNINGQISVNQGEAFAPATNGIRLMPGDRVMAQIDSAAIVKFDDECELKVEPNTILTLRAQSPCRGCCPLVQQLNPVGRDAIGAIAPSRGGIGWLVGLVAAIDLWWLDDEDDDDTVSP